MSALLGGLTKAAIDVLLPILAKSGAGLLIEAIKSRSPEAGQVVEAIAGRLGIPATPEAIRERFDEDPTSTAAVIQQVEADDPELWRTIANADNVRERIFQREATEPWWAWAWRPFTMYLLWVAWGWQFYALAARVETIETWILFQLTLLYLGLWMGGHTVKDLGTKVMEGMAARAGK